MRLSLLALLVLSAGANAQAASIDVVKSGLNNPRSIEHIRCDACARKVDRKAAAAVVELAPGTQKVEIREIDGVKKIYRTEAWMGGSPAVYVSKIVGAELPQVVETKSDASEDVASTPEATTAAPPMDETADMIDEKSKTSAVTSDMGADAKVAIKPAPFDPSKMQLRLN